MNAYLVRKYSYTPAQRRRTTMVLDGQRMGDERDWVLVGFFVTCSSSADRRNKTRWGCVPLLAFASVLPYPFIYLPRRPSNQSWLRVCLAAWQLGKLKRIIPHSQPASRAILPWRADPRNASAPLRPTHAPHAGTMHLNGSDPTVAPSILPCLSPLSIGRSRYLIMARAAPYQLAPC